MIKNCPKCGTEFDDFSKYGPKKFCSRKCANSRIITEERKVAVSLKLKKKPKEFICEYCSLVFETKRKSKRFCDITCANRFLAAQGYSEKFRENQSLLVKEHYKNGRKKFGGHHHVPWYDYKNIRVQGTYELRMCKLLDTWLERGLIQNWEYTNDRIQYFGIDKKPHTYLIDFKILKNNKSFAYIEVKGKISDTDFIKWKAVRDRGDQLLIVELKDLKIFEKRC
jgi:hypothetical protein